MHINSRSTKSEIIVPLFDESSESVVGTIDVESEMENAFHQVAEEALEGFVGAIRGLCAGSA